MKAWLAILAAASTLAAQTTPDTQETELRPDRNNGLRIEVVEGQGAINNITKGTAWEPVVQILDESNSPVQDAVVTFVLPGMGPGAAFTDGSKVLSVQSDESGRAVARGMRPNTVVGQFEIRITATQGGRSASTTITQTNAAPAAIAKKSNKTLIILLVAGGAAGGIAAATLGKGSSSSTPTTPNPPPVTPGSVTPGQPGFGAPH